MCLVAGKQDSVSLPQKDLVLPAKKGESCREMERKLPSVRGIRTNRYVSLDTRQQFSVIELPGNKNANLPDRSKRE